MKNALYLNFADDQLYVSNADGTARRIIVTPRKYWGLGLNLDEFLGGLRVEMGSANSRVKIIWQYSLDGVIWEDGASALIAEQSADGNYTGVHNTAAEQTPFVRIAVEVRDSAATTQVTASCSTWGYYKYRS